MVNVWKIPKRTDEGGSSLANPPRPFVAWERNAMTRAPAPHPAVDRETGVDARMFFAMVSQPGNPRPGSPQNSTTEPPTGTEGDLAPGGDTRGEALQGAKTPITPGGTSGSAPRDLARRDGRAPGEKARRAPALRATRGEEGFWGGPPPIWRRPRHDVHAPTQRGPNWRGRGGWEPPRA